MKAAISVIVSVLLFVSGCYSTRSYRGDGELIDHGFSFTGLHYEARLSDIRLDLPDSYEFRLANLPRRDFCIGFNINLVPNNASSYRSIDVDLRVTNEAGEIVIQESGPLEEWLWSYALDGNSSFIYRRGATVDIQVGKNTWKSTAVNIKADNGHGSCFKPRYHQEYLVTFAIKNPSSEFRSIFLVARSSGV